MVKPKAVTKRKKIWFVVISPEKLKKKEIAEIPAFEPNELIGRVVEINYAMITGLPRDQNKKVKLKITEVKGEKAYTVPTYYFYLDSYLQKIGKRNRGRFISVVNYTTKDKKEIKLKTYFLLKNKVSQSVRAELLRTSEKEIKNKIKSTDYEALFVPGFLETMSMDLSKKLSKIYPISRLIVWKLKLLNK